MSEKVKDTLHKIGGAILIIGLAMPVILIVTIFVDPSIFEKYLVTVIAAGIGCTTLGVVVLAFSGSLKITLPKKLAKRIADYAIPVLKSKGEVSLRDIATNIGAGVSDVKRCIEGMISEGYFEDARLESGRLVKNVIPCPYCGEPVRLTERKCPNCGAVIKK